MPGKREKRDRSEDVLTFFKGYLREQGRPPTDREIIDAIGLKSTSGAAYYIKKLIEDGKLEKQENVSRGLSLPRRQETPQSLTVPVLGRIAAGIPIMVPGTGLTRENAIGQVDVPESYIPPGVSLEDVFALEVSGDSMRDAMILDGDTVILHKTSNFHNGDIVAAWIVSEETTTLKRVRLTDKGVWLKPENPSNEFKETYYTLDDVELQGKVLGVLRLYN